MSLFFITFFLLYGSIHLYVFLKARAAFSLAPIPAGALAFCMALLVVTPFFVRLLERSGQEPLARAMAFVGYTWMGAIFILFLLSLLADVVRLVVWVGGTAARTDVSRITQASTVTFLCVLLGAAAIVCYGYFEALQIRTEKIRMKTDKLPPGVTKLTIAQVSDIHLGLVVRKERLEAILAQVRAADPDIVVSTGDLVDGQINELSEVIEPLRALRPRLGKYAVTGNHEFYVGIGVTSDFLKKTGFRLLRGEGETVGGVLNIAGVDDIAGRPYGGYKEIPEKVMLSDLPRDRFTVLLKHRPLVDNDAVGLFDIQLSGHVHKGQIFPFQLAVRPFFRYLGGLYDLSGGSVLYVNRGSGTWGPPIRFLAPPEVTIIEIVQGAR
jgi:predicted MPP superfamily phosphohydrolase